MIALDTSALAAILFREPEAEHLQTVIRRERHRIAGTPTLLEFYMVATGRSRPPAGADAAALIDILDPERVEFDSRHLAVARQAFDRFGKGRHPASLNFGDCMSYAVAAVAGCPLLYVGKDFPLTDIRPALPPA